MQFDKGGGCHAYSAIEVQLGGLYKSFSSLIGVDDYTSGSAGSVRFFVYGDGSLLYFSDVKTGADDAEEIAVDVTGVQVLKLEVTDAGDGKNNDHADWANTRLTTEPIGGTGDEPGGTVNPSAMLDSIRYAGEYYDAETGFIYLRNRYYDPTQRRFITEDPIRDGTNWYIYCGNNPVMYVDPWGLSKMGDEKYSESARDTIDAYTQIWEDAQAAYEHGLIDEYERRAVQEYAERKADEIRYSEDHPFISLGANVFEFVLFDFILSDFNDGTVYASDLSTPTLEKMYENEENFSFLMAIAATKATQKGKTLVNTKINGKMTRVDIEFSQGTKKSNLHVQIKGTGYKQMITKLDDIAKLPKAVQKNPRIVAAIKKGLNLLTKIS